MSNVGKELVGRWRTNWTRERIGHSLGMCRCADELEAALPAIEAEIEAKLRAEFEKWKTIAMDAHESYEQAEAEIDKLNAELSTAKQPRDLQCKKCCGTGLFSDLRCQICKGSGVEPAAQPRDLGRLWELVKRLKGYSKQHDCTGSGNGCGLCTAWLNTANELAAALAEHDYRILAQEHKPMSQCGGNCNHPYACRSSSAGAELICIACEEQVERVQEEKRKRRVEAGRQK